MLREAQDAEQPGRRITEALAAHGAPRADALLHSGRRRERDDAQPACRSSDRDADRVPAGMIRRISERM
ncbi:MULTISPECIES: hypothetical protein [unclassified Burkholderia]|uniref:hypothetical protein n=1 Tax=unclassified Burkholderia TaxID=2613784 RepID=UPI001146E2B9|nr:MULTISPECIES: hypothetical protein [unclassified Burkholderia]